MISKTISQMIKANHRWARRQKQKDRDYFLNMAQGQTPEILWIGCSDSRVPAETLSGHSPGQLFVHRNVANMVIHTDLNCLSVVQYAVDVLKVKHIIICGHTNCGGVNAAMKALPSGLISNWLMHIRDLYIRHFNLLSSLTTEHSSEILTRLNVAEQIYNLGRSSIVRDAWARGQELTITGLVYDISDGHLLEEGVDANDAESLEINYRAYIAKLLTLTDSDIDREHHDREEADRLAEEEQHRSMISGLVELHESATPHPQAPTEESVEENAEAEAVAKAEAKSEAKAES